MSNDLDEAHEELHGTFGNTAPVLRRVLATVLDHLRSHPVPPPSRSDENAGEASDDARAKNETIERLVDLFGAKERTAVAHTFNAGYDLGKRHQASADAATIAGLRSCLERITRHPHCSYEPSHDGTAEVSRSNRDYQIGVADGHRCAAGVAQLALEAVDALAKLRPSQKEEQ